MVNSLDSPGTSSGYCSGTEEEMAFSVSMFEPGLPTECPDIFAGGGSFPSYIDAVSDLDCAFPDGQDSLMMMNATTSGSEVRTWIDDVRNSDVSNIRELRDSWLLEMLFGTQSSTSEEEEALRNVDRTYDLDLDTIDFDTHLLSATLPAEKTEGPTEVLPTIACQSSPLCEESGFSNEQVVGGNETVNETTVGEEDWNVLMSFDDWDEVCDDEALLADDRLTLKDIWRDSVQSSDENPAKRKLCDDKDISAETSLTAVSAIAQGSDTRQLSPVQTTRMTCSAVTLNRIANSRIEVPTPEPTPCIEASSWTSPTGPSSFRANPPAQHKLSTGSSLPSDQSSRTSNYFRTQQRTSSTTVPATTQSTTHHMLEDHRYSSRRFDHVVKPVHTTRQPEVSKSSKYSVLETLLRTSVRFNPNHGSSFIITKESKKRSLNPTTSVHTAKQSTPSGQQTTKRHNHHNNNSNNNNNNNTLLHNLLTCRMEEVDTKRTGSRKSEQRGSSGKDHHVVGKNSLVVGLIPSDDPVVDCSFLYDDVEEQELLNVEDHNVDTRMAWMENVMEEDDKVSLEQDLISQELLDILSV